MFAPTESAYAKFLLVRHSNLRTILPRFRDITGFLLIVLSPIQPELLGCSRWTSLPLLGSARAKNLSYSVVKKLLLSKYSNLCENIPKHHRQTQRRTDHLLRHNRALLALAAQNI